MIIAIDFDGTIVEHEYPKIGKLIPFAFDSLKLLRKDGHQLILWTIREGKLLDDAIDFCKKNGVEFDAVNDNLSKKYDGEIYDTRKINADLFIDDRNLGGLPDWGVIYQLIKSGEIFEGFVIPETKTRKPKNVIIRLGEIIQKIIDERPV
ncbi:MAG: hypothetical protein PHV20_09175 [Bacteroidales bacterium]|nr:hypothetical protein [Bacteroidales bacterium]